MGVTPTPIPMRSFELNGVTIEVSTLKDYGADEKLRKPIHLNIWVRDEEVVITNELTDEELLTAAGYDLEEINMDVPRKALGSRDQDVYVWDRQNQCLLAMSTVRHQVGEEILFRMTYVSLDPRSLCAALECLSPDADVPDDYARGVAVGVMAFYHAVFPGRKLEDSAKDISAYMPEEIDTSKLPAKWRKHLVQAPEWPVFWLGGNHE